MPRSLKPILIILLLAAIAAGLWSVSRHGGMKPPPPPPGPTPASTDALRTAEQLIVQGDFSRAIVELRRAIEKAPNDQALHIQLAGALQSKEMWTEARHAIETAIEVGPATGAQGAAMHVQAGTLANKTNDIDKAIEHYQAAQKLEPTQPRHALFLAMMQLKNNDDNAAIASLYTATRLDDSLGEAWGTMAEIELRRNNLPMADQHVTKARAVQPDVLRWRLLHARIIRRANEPARAMALLTNLPDADRLSAPVAREIADCLGMLRRHAEASTLLEQAATAAKPDQRGKLLIDAARAAQRAADLDRAKTLAARALQSGEQSATDLIRELAESK